MKTSEPLISVIVPVYNVQSFIKPCVESILNSSYKNLEIILIDDGSTDNSGSICDSFKEIDSRIKVIHTTNGGLSNARNLGLDLCQGEYISFVDGDDWVDKDYFNCLFADLIHNDCQISAISFDRTDGKQNGYVSFEGVFDSNSIVRELLCDNIGSQVWQYLTPAYFWKDLRFISRRLYEDLPLTYKLLSKARRISVSQKKLYHYRINKRSISHKANFLKSYHLFLGFSERLQFAKLVYPDIADICISKTANFAISSVFHYCNRKDNEGVRIVNECKSFLDEYHLFLLEKNLLAKTRKTLLSCFYNNQKMFKLLSKIYHFFNKGTY